MRRLLPNKRSNKWLYVPPLLSLGITALFAVMARLILNYDSFNYPGLLIFNLLVGSIIALAGWLGAKLMFWCTTGGLVIGLILMFSIWTENTGWENLVGGLAMASLLGVGFLLGLVAELGAWFYRRRKQGQ